jgi:hypothetical protein
VGPVEARQAAHGQWGRVAALTVRPFLFNGDGLNIVAEELLNSESAAC